MRLLLVEDDVMVASGIKLGLCNAGYTVDWVGSAERALQALESDSFDLAIVDIGLPSMDGLALTRQLRNGGLEMPVLILPSVQINIRAGELPPKEDNGIAYAKIPLNVL